MDLDLYLVNDSSCSVDRQALDLWGLILILDNGPAQPMVNRKSITQKYLSSSDIVRANHLWK